MVKYVGCYKKKYWLIIVYILVKKNRKIYNNCKKLIVYIFFSNVK